MLDHGTEQAKLARPACGTNTSRGSHTRVHCAPESAGTRTATEARLHQRITLEACNVSGLQHLHVLVSVAETLPRVTHRSGESTKRPCHTRVHRSHTSCERAERYPFCAPRCLGTDLPAACAAEQRRACAAAPPPCAVPPLCATAPLAVPTERSVSRARGCAAQVPP